MRIMIIGRSGSGKSTFAVRLHSALGIPIYHLDKYFFKSHWVERDYAEFIVEQKKIIAQRNWIIDGNSTKSFELRYAVTDYCLYFNFPRWRCYWRVFKRLLYKNPKIDDRAPYCPETVRWSLLHYMFGFEHRVKPILTRLQATYPKVKFIELKTGRDVDNLLKSAVFIQGTE